MSDDRGLADVYYRVIVEERGQVFVHFNAGTPKALGKKSYFYRMQLGLEFESILPGKTPHAGFFPPTDTQREIAQSVSDTSRSHAQGQQLTSLSPNCIQ